VLQRSVSLEKQVIALLILLPFMATFVYAGIHEYRRYKSEGRANYGLVYDEETGTSHVAGIPDGQDGFDPEEFDPAEFNNREADEGVENSKT